MGLISNGTTLLDAGALDSGVPTGAMTLIKTLTASSSGTLSFVHGTSSVVLDSTYKEYVFKFINIHPATDGQNFTVNFRDGSTAFDATKTTTLFQAQHSEGDATNFSYQTGHDLAQGTGYQTISQYVGNGNDETCSGELFLFSPSSTTFVKHFISKANSYFANDKSNNDFTAGYCNVTAAIDGVQFKFSSGNIDAGTIKMYGIK
jgi:hypothetical protein